MNCDAATKLDNSSRIKIILTYTCNYIYTETSTDKPSQADTRNRSRTLQLTAPETDCMLLCTAMIHIANIIIPTNDEINKCSNKREAYICINICCHPMQEFRIPSIGKSLRVPDRWHNYDATFIVTIA